LVSKESATKPFFPDQSKSAMTWSEHAPVISAFRSTSALSTTVILGSTYGAAVGAVVGANVGAAEPSAAGAAVGTEPSAAGAAVGNEPSVAGAAVGTEPSAAGAAVGNEPSAAGAAVGAAEPSAAGPAVGAKVGAAVGEQKLQVSHRFQPHNLSMGVSVSVMHQSLQPDAAESSAGAEVGHAATLGAHGGSAKPAGAAGGAANGVSGGAANGAVGGAANGAIGGAANGAASDGASPWSASALVVHVSPLQSQKTSARSADPMKTSGLLSATMVFPVSILNSCTISAKSAMLSSACSVLPWQT